MLLIDTPDGGDLIIENGLIKSDPQFSTAVYLSLFGGNIDDPGKTNTKRSWWGNLFALTESEKIRSRFQFIINGLPMTVKNIREAEVAAGLDLDWMIKEEIADEINIQGRSINQNTFELEVEILKDGNTLFENTYSLLWQGGRAY